MSGCENLLVNEENRDLATVFENDFWTATHGPCLDDGVAAPARRLRRVIRKLPILGAVPEQPRLSASYASRYANHPKDTRTSGGRTPALLLDFYLSWMSGCENLLVNEENRDLATVFENDFWTATHGPCLDDGVAAPARRLRRVIRKLPILGAVPEQPRLSASYASRYANHPKDTRTSGGRTPALLLDFYLSWKSLFPLGRFADAPRLLTAYLKIPPSLRRCAAA